MEFKGTKGKWFVDYSEQYINENNVLCTPISTNKVIYLCEIYGDDETAKADALLISKAPEMLEKLAEVKDLLEAYPSEAEMHLKAVEIRQLIKEATEL